MHLCNHLPEMVKLQHIFSCFLGNMDSAHIWGKSSAWLSDREVFLCKSEGKIAKCPIQGSFPVQHSQLSWDCQRCWVICSPEAEMFSGSNWSEMDLNAELSFCFYSVSPHQCLFICLKPKIFLLVIYWLLLKAWKFLQNSPRLS